MKKVLLFLMFILSFNLLHGQVGYVEYGNPVYDFLNRMDALHIIEEYNSFEIPKSRRTVAEHLKRVERRSYRLNDIDKEKLKDFLIEFEYDLKESVRNSTSFLSSPNLRALFGIDNEKYLYRFRGENDANLFVNFIGNSRNLFEYDRTNDEDRTSTIINFGGKIRGSIYDHFGFSIKATNGTYLGNRPLAQGLAPLRYHFKVQGAQNDSTIADDYFDQTFGYFTAQYKNLRFKIGRDKQMIGYGPIKPIISPNAPPMDYLALSFDYSFFNFSFFHGKLQGKREQVYDSVQGGIATISDKFLSYHRFGFDLSKHLQFGIGEMAVYANRSMDLSYLNPFNYYKSIEHINKDRDNLLIFFDLVNNSIKGLKFYSTLLIDDMDFGKFGTSHYVNKTLLSAGVRSSQLYPVMPVELEFQYLRIEPYVYSHRIYDNNYTSQGFSLVDPLQPNSELFHFELSYYPFYRLTLKTGFKYKRHGANELDAQGNVVTNHGGNVLVGHREGDSEYASLLDGVLEHSRKYFFEVTYEPINNYLLEYKVEYINFDSPNENYEEIISNINFSIRI